MSKLKTPQAKKRASYDRDHRTDMEAPHAFRKNWPKKKARIARGRRRAAGLATRSVLLGADPDGVLVPRRRRGEHIRKMGVAPLRHFVRRRAERRRQGFLPRYMGEPYDAQAHVPRFRQFVSALVCGRSSLAAARALYLRELLDAQLPDNAPQRYKRRWLYRAFSDAPQCEDQLRTWIASFRRPG